MKRAPITALLSRASALLIIRDTNFVEIRVAINFYLHRSCFKPKLQIQKVLLFLMRLHFWKFWGFQFLGSVFGLQPAGLWVGFWWRLASGSLLFAYFAAASLVFFFKMKWSWVWGTSVECRSWKRHFSSLFPVDRIQNLISFDLHTDKDWFFFFK